ncbi:MAG TPA: hypothetical protein VFT55_06120 [Planctomycetota bacterium]|nr:hypothetical protein [Planctomycetota bacterium]
MKPASHHPKRLLAPAITALLACAAATAQETVEQRLDRIERENRELRQRVDQMAGAPAAQEQQPGAGLPPGSKKVYSIGDGLSVAGYGEMLFSQNSGRTDVADALRAVIYFGYRFDPKWLFHSEIEVEHGSTSTSSGTTTSAGEVSLEFGYLEHLFDDNLSLRTGLVLMPVGLVNEKHEPTEYLPASRSQTETRILPTTWREIGIEGVATFGDLDAKLFAGTGLDGEEFDQTGLRGGRQKANRAAADDIATALRVDWHACEGLLAGSSVVYQKAGQDGVRGTTPIPEMDTFIAEAHVDFRSGPWIARGLYATVFSDDALEFATATGRNLADRSYGAYVELGCDVATWLFPASTAALTPFVRYEHIDTQAWMPEGIPADASQDNTILTIGLNWKPIDRIVFKADFEEWSDSFDRFNLAMGYVF